MAGRCFIKGNADKRMRSAVIKKTSFLTALLIVFIYAAFFMASTAVASENEAGDEETASGAITADATGEAADSQPAGLEAEAADTTSAEEQGETVAKEEENTETASGDVSANDGNDQELVSETDGSETATGESSETGFVTGEITDGNQGCEDCGDGEAADGIEEGSGEDCSPEEYLELICGFDGDGEDGVYWESAQNYEDGILTVRYRIVNNGTEDYVNVRIESVTATNGVKLVNDVPVSLGDLGAGEYVEFELQWQLPEDWDFASFGTTINICADCPESGPFDDPDPDPDPDPQPDPKITDPDDNGSSDGLSYSLISSGLPSTGFTASAALALAAVLIGLGATLWRPYRFSGRKK